MIEVKGEIRVEKPGWSLEQPPHLFWNRLPALAHHRMRTDRVLRQSEQGEEGIQDLSFGQLTG
jgi:hypothetical protein